MFMSREDILKKLTASGVLPTTQRMEVAEVLLDKPQHMSADQIIDVLQQRGRRVSKATVYNTLKLFSERGLVRELHVDASRKYYDSTTHPHHHFFHVDSGELQDIPAGEIEVRGLPPLPAGTEQEGVEVMIRLRNSAKES
ncbi:MAG: transcriptional repressor [Woeseia sp.]|nr:transcriptional repressor [Woeseia sp.]